jgi:two-component system, sporulation sensor kinase E
VLRRDSPNDSLVGIVERIHDEPSAEQISRCPAEQTFGQPLDKFIPLKFREARREHNRTFGDSRSMYSPGTLMTDGEEFPVEATISQVKTASETLFIVILRDTSI